MTKINYEQYKTFEELLQEEFGVRPKGDPVLLFSHWMDTVTYQAGGSVSEHFHGTVTKNLEVFGNYDQFANIVKTYYETKGFTFIQDNIFDQDYVKDSALYEAYFMKSKRDIHFKFRRIKDLSEEDLEYWLSRKSD